jgi:hypothetical protein
MTKRKLTSVETVRRYYAKFPDAKHAEVASATGIDIKHLYVIKNKLKTSGRLPTIPAVPLTTITTRESISTMLEPTYRGKILMQAPERMTVSATPDSINHPAHYTAGGIETIDFIEAKKLNYNLGNVVKYLTRADHKGSKLEDLRKAQWYLTREINSTK